MTSEMIPPDAGDITGPQRYFAEPLPISLEVYLAQVEWFRVKAECEMAAYREQVELYALKFRNGVA